MFNILTSLLAGTEEAPKPNWFQSYGLYIVLGVLVVAIIVWFVFSGRKNKQKQKEYVEQLDAIGPGNKVKTAGGICGIVTEVCDDNTVIIKTGSEESGYSFVKMDKELIAQTDAKGPSQIAREEAEARRKEEREAKAAEKAAASLNDNKPEEVSEVKTEEKEVKTEEKTEESVAEEKTDEPNE